MVNLFIPLQTTTKPTCIAGLAGLPYRNAPVIG